MNNLTDCFTEYNDQRNVMISFGFLESVEFGDGHELFLITYEEIKERFEMLSMETKENIIKEKFNMSNYANAQEFALHIEGLILRYSEN